jgi:hypothetical protein
LRRGGGRQRQRGKVSIDWRWIVAGALGLMLVTAAWFASPKAQILRAINGVIPLTDSADSVLDEVVGNERKIQSALETIRQTDGSQKEDARRAALKLLKSLRKPTDELWLRAARVDPMSSEEYEAFKHRNNDRRGDLKMNSGLALIFELPKIDPHVALLELQNPGSHTNELEEAHSRADDTLAATELQYIEFLVLVLAKTTAVPRCDLDPVLAQMAAIERDSLKKVSHLDSALQIDRAIPFITEQTDRLNKLSEQAARIDDHGQFRIFPATAEFSKLSGNVGTALLAIDRILTTRYGPNATFHKALFELGSAGAQFPKTARVLHR